MKGKKEWGVLAFLLFVLISTLVFIKHLPSEAENPDLPRVVFLVSWYDVGEDVLEGLNGVELVNSDYNGSNETNTVWYDPALISIDDMEKALKEAGTYLGTERHWGI